MRSLFVLGRKEQMCSKRRFGGAFFRRLSAMTATIKIFHTAAFVTVRFGW